MVSPAAVLARFSPPTREWFTSSFDSPTSAQTGAWDAVSSGLHTLVVAPTGSGKTLAAFLWAIDQLIQRPDTSQQFTDAETKRSVSVLYISPLKALASDIQRNLTAPLVGIGHAAARLGAITTPITTGARTGDTPAAERRAFPKNPPDILVTTPESLFLLLTSAARTALTGVHTVIIDEIHALAGTKRGAHLAVSLERLDELCPRPTQRVGLSATVNPVAACAVFLGGARAPEAGGREVRVVQPPSEKRLDLHVAVPLVDMTDIGSATGDLSGAAAGQAPAVSVWPHIEADIVNRIDPVARPGASTLVFANARRGAERLTARLNEEWQQRIGVTQDAEADNGAGGVRSRRDSISAATDESGQAAPPPGARTAISVIGASGTAAPVAVEIARAHHGSVSKEHRRDIEEALKRGQLPAVVATSSLELGIDMGAIDDVIMVSPPPSVASGLQRIGRAGHHVGAISRGVLYPKHRNELVPAAVTCERMLAGRLEPLRMPANPLDVLAQQIVAIVATGDTTTADLYTLVRRAAPFATLTRTVFDAVLDMLAGRYPSTEFAELRPRLVWDRVTDTLTARPGAARLAVTSGGTIPDRGLFGVFLADGDGPGRRVGELDEEMVYESRVGDVFTLGTSTWRIHDITHDRVLVTPAPGEPGRLPFWHGDNPGRPAALGDAIAQFYRDAATASGGPTGEQVAARLRAAGCDDNAVANTGTYLAEQITATGALPDDRTVVVERFRDELGDWRVVVHSPRGHGVHAPWALVIQARLQAAFGVQVQVMPSDDGIVIRLPDVVADELAEPGGGADDDHLGVVLAALTADPDTVHDDVMAGLTDSALFASRFRECAARALMLPKRNPGKRQPLWQQRQRAASLLAVALKYPTFPMVLETARECLRDVFDVPRLADLLRDIRSGTVSVREVQTASASPFAQSLLFGYVAQFLYDGDSPVAERRAAALALDPQLLAELLGQSDGTSLADLLDPDAVLSLHADLQRLSPDRQCRNAEDVADTLRLLGPLTMAELTNRTVPEHRDHLAEWVTDLEKARRVFTPSLGGRAIVAAVEDAGLLRDGLGVPLPVGVPDAFTTPVTDPLRQLLSRHARTHAGFAVNDVAAAWGLGPAVVAQAADTLRKQGVLACGDLIPLAARDALPGWDDTSSNTAHYCDETVLRRLRKASLAALRAEVEPVSQATLAAFYTSWHGLRPLLNAEGAPETTRHGLRGVDGVLTVIETLAGLPLPASAWESLVLPGRVADYAPALLDELCSAGEVVWTGHGSLPGRDGWIAFHPTDAVDLTRKAPTVTPADLDDLPRTIIATVAGGGAYLAADIAATTDSPTGAALADAIWSATWAGHVTSDTFAPVRAYLAGSGSHRTPAKPRRGRFATRSGLRQLRPRSAPHVAGRWSATVPATTDATIRAHATTELMLDRHGIVTRGAVATEDVPGGFAAIYRVLAAKEDTGALRRGYFVDGLGAAQFGTAGAVDRLRAPGSHGTVVLAATDPANPYGAALPWPERPDTGKHRPARRAGAMVVLTNGHLVAYLERGAKTLLTYPGATHPDTGPAPHYVPDSPPPMATTVPHSAATPLGLAAKALSVVVASGRISTITIHTIDGQSALQAPAAIRDALQAAGFVPTPRGFRARR